MKSIICLLIFVHVGPEENIFFKKFNFFPITVVASLQNGSYVVFKIFYICFKFFLEFMNFSVSYFCVPSVASLASDSIGGSTNTVFLR